MNQDFRQHTPNRMEKQVPWLIVLHATVVAVMITATRSAQQSIATPAVCFPIEPTEETVQPNEHIATANPSPTHQENSSQVETIVICFPLEQAPRPESTHQSSNGHVVQENSDPPTVGGGVG